MGWWDGIFGARWRGASDSSLLLEYVAERRPGQVSLPIRVPGQILPIDRVSDGFLVHCHGFLLCQG